MARLPVPGADSNSWGDILNQFLNVVHATDGSLKTGSVGATQLQNGAVSSAKLDSTVQASLIKADNSLNDNGVAALVNNQSSATGAAINSSYATKVHTHAISQITSLQTSLDVKGTAAYGTAVLIESNGVYPSRPTGYANAKFIGATDPGFLALNGDEWIQLT